MPVKDNPLFFGRTMLGAAIYPTARNFGEALAFALRTTDDEIKFRIGVREKYLLALNERIDSAESELDDAVQRSVTERKSKLVSTLKRLANGHGYSSDVKRHADEFELAKHNYQKIVNNLHVRGTAQWEAFNEYVREVEQREIIAPAQKAFAHAAQNALEGVFYELETLTQSDKQTLYELAGLLGAETWDSAAADFAYSQEFFTSDFIERHSLSAVPVETFFERARTTRQYMIDATTNTLTDR